MPTWYTARLSDHGLVACAGTEASAWRDLGSGKSTLAGPGADR